MYVADIMNKLFMLRLFSFTLKTENVFALFLLALFSRSMGCNVYGARIGINNNAEGYNNNTTILHSQRIHVDTWYK